MPANPVAIILIGTITAVLAVEVVTAVIRGATACLVADILAIVGNNQAPVACVNRHTLLTAVKVGRKEVIARLVVCHPLAVTPAVTLVVALLGEPVLHAVVGLTVPAVARWPSVRPDVVLLVVSGAGHT